MHETTIEHITTADGATLALKRRPNPGGIPVVLFHGLAVNAEMWDLPPVDTPEYQYRSLASLLDEAGYDVWLVNFRGHGQKHSFSEPPPGAEDWSVDEFILFDVPAVVGHVAQVSQQRPFLIAQSMGSMSVGGYLIGARCEGAAGVVCDPVVAATRQAQLAGVVLVEFPVVLRWPKQLYDENGSLRWETLAEDWWRAESGVNLSFEIASRLRWLELLIVAYGGVPLDKLRPSGWGEAVLERLPSRWAEAWRTLETRAVSTGMLWLGKMTGHPNHRAEVLISGRRYVIDAMKAGVLRQLAECVRLGQFVSWRKAPRSVYSDHYANISLPTLMILGGRDRIANAEIGREFFFERISATDKTIQVYETLAHGEFEAAPIATQQVYPPLLDWLEERQGFAAGDKATQAV